MRGTLCATFLDHLLFELRALRSSEPLAALADGEKRRLVPRVTFCPTGWNYLQTVDDPDVEHEQ